MSNVSPARFPWPPVLFVACLAVAWFLQRVIPLSWPGLDDKAARFVGLAFGVAGIALLIWAIHSLSRAQTTILPHRKSEALVTNGAFAVVRNPMYLADVFLMFAVAEITKNIWFVIMALVFAALVTWLAILPEEAHLESRFGDAYRKYKADTRRWI